MKNRQSYQGEAGQRLCDCAECIWGGNGDASCGEGWTDTRPGVKGCQQGHPIEPEYDTDKE